MRNAALFLVFGAALLGGSAEASGTGEAAQPLPTAAPRSPEQLAAEHYNDGLSRVKRADESRLKAVAESDAAKRAKLDAKAREDYARAVQALQQAVERHPRRHEAQALLGPIRCPQASRTRGSGTPGSRSRPAAGQRSRSSSTGR